MRRSQLWWTISFLGILGFLAFLHMTAPEMVPMRYDLQGNVIGWATREGHFKFAYGFVFLMNVIFGFFATPIAFRMIPPKWWNVPYKDYWFAPQRLEEGKVRVGDMMAWGCFATNVVMAFVLGLVALQNAGTITGDHVNIGVMFVVVISFLSIPVAHKYMKPA